MKDKPKTTRQDVLMKIQEIVKENTIDPADEMIACGEALVAIGKTLKGVSAADARAIVAAAVALS